MSEAFKGVNGQATVRVKCSCGSEFNAIKRKVFNGNTKSCGCLRRDRFLSIVTKHGLSRRPMYSRWENMIKRCENKNNPGYKDYGGRGIFVCQRWRESFKNYLDDVGDPPFDGAEIDRIDNNRGYEPGNVRWTGDREQNNNSRKCRKIEHNGEVHTLSQWAEILGYAHSSLQYRLDNMPLDEALTPKSRIKTWKQRNLRRT